MEVEEHSSSDPIIIGLPPSARNEDGLLVPTIQKSTRTVPSHTRLPTLPPAALPRAAPAPTAEEFCHFCCDLVQSTYRHECVDCGAIVCEQAKPRQSGCVLHQSLDKTKGAFLCLMCHRKKKSEQLPYLFVGYGLRNRVKMLWPLCIINISLESLTDVYIGHTVELDLSTHYQAATSKVS